MMALGVERSSPSRDSRSTKRCVRDTPSDATAVVARTGIINLDGVVACFGMIDILSQSGYGCSQLAPGTLRVGYVQLDPTEDAIEDKCRNCTFFVPLVVLNRSRSLTWIFQIKFSLATTNFSVLPPPPPFRMPMLVLWQCIVLLKLSAKYQPKLASKWDKSNRSIFHSK